jgi:hypothetical protein
MLGEEWALSRSFDGKMGHSPFANDSSVIPSFKKLNGKLVVETLNGSNTTNLEFKMHRISEYGNCRS